MGTSEDIGNEQLISVIIPVYNDPDGIQATLDAVLDQTYPNNQYEVLVVDNNSTDQTRNVICSYRDNNPRQVTLLVEDQIQSPAAARNRGIEHASGSILAFIDSDMTVEETWLASVVETLLGGSHDYMGCRVETYIPKGCETIAAEYDRLFSFPMEQYITESKFAGTGCLVVRNNVFEKVGKFDPRLKSSEDKEFGQRVHQSGFELHFEPSITMYHPVRSSIIEQVKKSFRIGQGLRQLHEIYPNRFDAKNPLHLRSYLPLKPYWFYSQISNNESYSIFEMVGLYMIGSIKKISKSAGSLYEYLNGKIF